MTYLDPRSLGARCDLCPLKDCRPVPTEWPRSFQGEGFSTLEAIVGSSDNMIALVGDHPGEAEERQGSQFVGESGDELNSGLMSAGIKRSQAVVTSAILCRPPKNKLKELTTSIIKQRNKDPEFQMLTPLEACRPRLEAELSNIRNFVTLGKYAYQAIVGGSSGVLAIRGSLIHLPAEEPFGDRKVLPTVHPSFVLRAQRWRHVFRSDLQKARRFFSNQEKWVEPKRVYNASPTELKKFLSSHDVFAWDTETDSIEPLTAKLRCIGIGTSDEVHVISLLGKDGITRFYPKWEENEIVEVMKDFLVDPTKLKIGHNSTTYDRTVIQSRWGVVPNPQLDTLLLHKVVESELPHNLGYVSSLYLDIGGWKCYDEETEVLTPDGWVKFPDLNSSMKVAQWENGKVRFVKPEAYVNQKYQGKVWSLQDQATDLVVTPGHKMLYSDKNDFTDRKECLVEDLPSSGFLIHPDVQEKLGLLMFLRSGISSLSDLKREEIDFNGRIYCVTVPSGFILVRRNGKITVSGNSDREGNKISTHAESDEELAKYCGTDVVATRRIFDPLLDQVKLRGQVEVLRGDHKLSEICAVMKGTGMYVDQEARAAKEKELLMRRIKLLKEIRDRVGNPKFNPGSVYQLREVLFDRWKIEVPLDDEIRLTGTDDPSTADIVLRAILSDSSVKKDHRDFVKAVRYFRKVQKVLGTYVAKLRYSNIRIESDLGWDDDEDWIDVETREKYGLERTGIVDPRTGRMYPGWSTLTTTGRLASSKPINAMNFPGPIRAVVTAAPGNLLVGADADQLELRIAAAWWQVGIYLKAFREGKDPHSMTAYAIFGDEYARACGVDPSQFRAPGPFYGGCFKDGNFEKKLASEDALQMRHLAKIIQYASQYMGSVETVHDIVKKTELPAKDPITGKSATDGTTDLPYALIPQRKVRRMHSDWLLGAPEFKHGWDRELRSFKKLGYAREPVGGRRRDFLDGEDANAIVNLPIQGSAASLMNKALISIYEKIPMWKWGPGTGIINQCHDAIVVECPEKEAPWVAKVIEEYMNQSHPALPGVTFTAKAKIARTWEDV